MVFGEVILPAFTLTLRWALRQVHQGCGGLLHLYHDGQGEQVHFQDTEDKLKCLDLGPATT